MLPLELKPNEKTFNVVPIGIKYTCEFCGEGEMKYDPQPITTALLSNPPLHPHTCTKCGKTMQLPKMYPYIEWVPSN